MAIQNHVDHKKYTKEWIEKIQGKTDYERVKNTIEEQILENAKSAS